MKKIKKPLKKVKNKSTLMTNDKIKKAKKLIKRMTDEMHGIKPSLLTRFLNFFRK